MGGHESKQAPKEAQILPKTPQSENIHKGTEKAGESFDVVLTPARSPFPPRVLSARNSYAAAAAAAVSPEDLDARQAAAEARRRDSIKAKVETAQRLEKGPGDQTVEERRLAKLDAIKTATKEKEDAAEARRCAHIADVVAKAASAATPPRKASIDDGEERRARIDKRLEEAEARRTAALNETVDKLHKQDEHAAEVRNKAVKAKKEKTEDDLSAEDMDQGE